MAKPNELLAASLAELRGVTQNGTRSVVKSESSAVSTGNDYRTTGSSKKS